MAICGSEIGFSFGPPPLFGPSKKVDADAGILQPSSRNEESNGRIRADLDLVCLEICQMTLSRQMFGTRLERAPSVQATKAATREGRIGKRITCDAADDCGACSPVH
ncbi:hypothetical protein L1887_59198 [Cichorium endivia]|nr:hypothetical protein L1887_59198 [Cichorium endivia]